MNRYIPLAFFLVSAATFTTPSPQALSQAAQQTGKKILIIGHRGSPGMIPEHTLKSYRMAIQQGADYIEPDLVSTKDGILIARHENNLAKTTDVAKKFPRRKRTKSIDGRRITGWFSEDFTIAEIKTLRAKQSFSFRDQDYNGHFKVPTFDEILYMLQKHNKNAKKKVGVYPETKHPTYFKSIGLPLEDRLLQSLRKYKLDGKGAPVFIQSFEVSNLQYLRKRTQVRLVQLLLLPSMKPYDFLTKKDKRTYGDLMKPEGLRFVATYANGIGPWKGLILPGGRRATKRSTTNLIRDAHKAGLLVHAYTFRNEKMFLSPLFKNNPILEYHFFFKLGLDGLFSDFPQTAVKARKSFTR